MNTNNIGRLWVVAAPSGGGKTSLVEATIADMPLVIRSISFTTRPQRPGEVDGRDYRFVDNETFQSYIDAGEMLEYEKVFDNYYGTSLTFINTHLAKGKDVILTIDWQGARQVRQKSPQAKSIFILPPNQDVLEQRLRHRGQDDDSIIAYRMAQATEQISHYKEFDYVIVNDCFDRALSEMKTIILADRLSQERQAIQQADLINQLLSS